MTYQCIKYRLTQEGQPPTFLYTAGDASSGYYPYQDNLEPWPRNIVLIGITIESSGDFEVIPTSADLEIYLNATYPELWKITDQPDPNTGVMVMLPMTANEAATKFWVQLDALNAT
jgi:hypothetical protein